MELRGKILIAFSESKSHFGQIKILLISLSDQPENGGGRIFLFLIFEIFKILLNIGSKLIGPNLYLLKLQIS